ncbi:hypothetical protein SAMN02745716_1253 [Thermoleophilum album]|uniref:Uncharacterized protein n=1 Tax=Thermoleophilum album TaxID=29539 RepID=A0A1H6FRZ2_THEAL|nr:hypothetical protein SAMN02745716_1253 [Thermoleophilum album]
MRDPKERLRHILFDIDLDIVSEAASRDAPALKPSIEKRLLKRLKELGYGG